MGLDIATIALIGLAVTIAATAASAYMQYEKGQQEKKVAKYQARTAEQQAAYARQAAEARSRDLRERNRRIMATARANAGASGIALTAGTSPLAVLAYNAREGELDAQRAIYSGEVDASGMSGQAKLMQWSGKNAEASANAGAGTTLLSGLGSAAGGYATKGGGATGPIRVSSDAIHSR